MQTAVGASRKVQGVGAYVGQPNGCGCHAHHKGLSCRDWLHRGGRQEGVGDKELRRRFDDGVGDQGGVNQTKRGGCRS